MYNYKYLSDISASHSQEKNIVKKREIHGYETVRIGVLEFQFEGKLNMEYMYQ